MPFIKTEKRAFRKKTEKTRLACKKNINQTLN